MAIPSDGLYDGLSGKTVLYVCPEGKVERHVN